GSNQTWRAFLLTAVGSAAPRRFLCSASPHSQLRTQCAGQPHLRGKSAVVASLCRRSPKCACPDPATHSSDKIGNGCKIVWTVCSSSLPVSQGAITKGKVALSASLCAAAVGDRSEEHTSELQSPYDLVCR